MTSLQLSLAWPAQRSQAIDRGAVKRDPKAATLL
jgi:hypothetical protein